MAKCVEMCKKLSCTMKLLCKEAFVVKQHIFFH